jgi:FkbH-like protein
MIRIDHTEGLNSYLLKIKFKQWGKLWTAGMLKLYPTAEAARKERTNTAVGAAVRWLPLPPGIRARALRKVSYLRRQATEKALGSTDPVDYFLLECYNPNGRAIGLTLTVRPRDRALPHLFQRMVVVAPGFTREMIPASEITQRIDLRQPFGIEIVPNDCDNTTLYFGFMDFVRERIQIPSASPPEFARKAWKCIVWDLDNTLWDGVLVEDGAQKISVRTAVMDVIKETDKRGILHSIASKNDQDEAMKVLRSHGIDEYFLHPQINWQPKSESISRIAQLLNIGVDAIAFVDDQPFEREEVKRVLASANVIDAKHCEAIPSRPECRVPVTEESRQRRQMYRQQQEREMAVNAYQGDYMAFLKECDIRLSIAPLSEANLERVYELAQRTNQMNFSGNRYPRQELKELLRSKNCQTCVISCTDKFGSYGIVGFAVVETGEPRLLDLMFSCRIQSKRVEHAFLSFLLTRFVRAQSRDFFANYRQTPRNSASGKVFEEMGFEKAGENEGALSLVFSKDRAVPEEGVVKIIEVKGD